MYALKRKRRDGTTIIIRLYQRNWMTLSEYGQIKRALDVMLQLQREQNVKVHPEWDKQGFEFYRAIWVECAELLDHYGWKWWKKQEPDLPQVRLEIVDIWHFALSHLMTRGVTTDEMAHAFSINHDRPKPKSFPVAVEVLARATLDGGFDIVAFIDTLNALPMSFDELYAIYKGKNVLNHFRQDHGYKSGEYVKNWNGSEDNVHLVEVLRDLSPDDSGFEKDLYKALAMRYAKVHA